MSQPRKVFKGLITQSGTNAPTLVELENSIGDLTLGYTSPGIYTITKTDAWTQNKTFARIAPVAEKSVGIVRTSANALTVNTADLTAGAWVAGNGVLTATPIEITVYE